jgi:hypothetical protein
MTRQQSSNEPASKPDNQPKKLSKLTTRNQPAEPMTASRQPDNQTDEAATDNETSQPAMTGNRTTAEPTAATK